MNAENVRRLLIPEGSLEEELYLGTQYEPGNHSMFWANLVKRLMASRADSQRHNQPTLSVVRDEGASALTL